jgi:transposase-like protein
MTAAPHDIDPARFLGEHLAQASPDLLREMLTTFINTLLSADADQVCGASYGMTSPDRTNRRNGYRHRDFDTRGGTVDVAIPKLRQGSYFPEWLLERRRRAEAALTTVVATSYLLGASTHRMNDLVQSLGITGLSKLQVSEMAKDLDEQVEQFRTRPLDQGLYTFVAADALTMKVREGGRVIEVAVLLATGVNAERYREILGLQTSSTEDGAGWADVLPRPHSARPDRREARHQRRARRARLRYRRDAARRGLAALTRQHGGGGIVPLVHPHRRERTLAT